MHPANYKVDTHAGIFQILLESSLPPDVLGYFFGSILGRLLLIPLVHGIDDHTLDQILMGHPLYNILPHIG